MRNLVLLSLLYCLMCSCSTFSNLSETISDTKEVISDLRDKYDELQPAIEGAVGTVAELYEQGSGLVEELGETGEEFKTVKEKAFEEADKDEDGDLDWLERLSYIVLLGGGTLELGRRKLKKITGGIEHERSKRKELEAAVNEKPG